MKVRYLYSACISITTPDVTILCDPWFGRAYDGAWCQWPEIEHPVAMCGPADFVYISHVHPDHYDPAFLTQYLTKYPQAKLIIADHKPALLARKLTARGMTPIVLSDSYAHVVGETKIKITTNANQFDSAITVQWRDQMVIGMNDNPFDATQLGMLMNRHARYVVACIPFVGAGPWPQAYDFDDPEQQRQAAARKKQQYLDLFSRYVQEIKPTVAVPYAGQYWLHGSQLDLNPLRGMADATECRSLEYMPEGAGQGLWVPADGGQSTLTIEENGTTWWNTERKEPYDWQLVRRKLPQRSYYRYEQEIRVPVARLPLLKLLQSAVRNASVPSLAWRETQLHLYIKAEPLPQWFYIDANKGRVTEVDKQLTVHHPRYEVTIDARYLFGMLTRLYNANNVRIGSLTRFKVVPLEPFDAKLYDLMGEFWDSLRA